MKKKPATGRAGKPIEADWYDYPQYYDMLFRDETPFEADFVEAACLKYGVARRGTIEGLRLLEPGCGTGRLAVEMSHRGCQITGFDLSEPMLRYARQRLKRRGLSAELLKADMTDFQIEPAQFDAAYCLIGTFRHLLSEGAAESHLKCVARHVRPGGIYILGFHLIPPDADPECIERWSASHGGTRVSGTLRVLDFDRPGRRETIRVSILARRTGSDRPIRIRSDFPLRLYMADQFQRLIAKLPEWRLGDVFDFNYEIDEPLVLDDELSDAAFILHRV